MSIICNICIKYILTTRTSCPITTRDRSDVYFLESLFFIILIRLKDIYLEAHYRQFVNFFFRSQSVLSFFANNDLLSIEECEAKEFSLNARKSISD